MPATSINTGNEGIDREDVERMHREVGASLQAEIDRGEEGSGLVRAGFHEHEIPEPSNPVENPEDDVEERARAALSAGHTLIEHEGGSDAAEPAGRAWTERARKLYDQGEINFAQADIMSGLDQDHGRSD